MKSKYRTQKARGIKMMHVLPGNFPKLFSAGPIVPPVLVQVLPYDEPKLPAFARPCPVRPRHGFVDSQEVSSIRQVAGLVHKLALTDPEGEIVFMPSLADAKYSAVVNRAGITYGRGNDGATSGQSCLFVPSPVSAQSWRASTSGGVADLGVEEEAYLELVADKDVFRAVQLRDGPASKAATNFIPARVEVKKVLTPIGFHGNGGADVSPDGLLLWEAQVLAAKGEEGVVVYLPNASLACHYAVHAMAIGIPVVTRWSGSLAPGTVLELEAECAKAGKLSPRSLRQLANLLAYWCQQPIDSRALNTQIAAAVAGVHAQWAWGEGFAFNNLRAFGVALVARLTMAACMGEARHFYNYGPGLATVKEAALRRGCWTNPETLPLAERMAQAGDAARVHTIPWTKLALGAREAGMSGRAFICPETMEDIKRLSMGSARKLKREGVFERAFTLTLPDMLALAPCVEADLQADGWLGSFGGRAWERSATEAQQLLECIYAFIVSPTREAWEKVTLKANSTINMVHNGGQILTKWIAAANLANYANVPSIGLASPIAATLALRSQYWAQQARGARTQLLAIDLDAVAAAWASPLGEAMPTQDPVAEWDTTEDVPDMLEELGDPDEKQGSSWFPPLPETPAIIMTASMASSEPSAETATQKEKSDDEAVPF